MYELNRRHQKPHPRPHLQFFGLLDGQPLTAKNRGQVFTEEPFNILLRSSGVV